MLCKDFLQTLAVFIRICKSSSFYWPRQFVVLVNDRWTFFLRCLNFENARRSLFINISSINSSFKKLLSHLKVELLFFGDSKLSEWVGGCYISITIHQNIANQDILWSLFWLTLINMMWLCVWVLLSLSSVRTWTIMNFCGITSLFG